MKALKKLFSPISIGSMELKNRLVMSPMTTQWAAKDEFVPQRIIDYHEARARGGVGLITSEVCTVDRLHKYQAFSLGLWDDKFIPGHIQLTKAIHAHGARVVPQISHPGPESLSFLFKRTQAVGPSPVQAPTTGHTCREITLEEIETVIEQYGEAARRAREAGYDGLELHAAHSYMLMGSFLSPLRNKRTDAYGGSLEGRLRFPLEVIKRIRTKVGSDFPIIVRVSGDERMPGGQDIPETQKIAAKLVEVGVNALHISGGVNDSLSTHIIPSTGVPRGINVPAAAAVKKVVDVPVMVVGKINDPRFAEDILRKNQADLIVMGRGLMADPELPNKAAEGRFEDIRRCIYCDNCFDSLLAIMNLNCAVNAAMGRERELKLEPVARPRKIMIVGGGPGGMEAARVTALRGHQVTLYEKGGRLGGSLTFAATVHSDNEYFLNYLLTQIKKLPVEVKLRREVKPALIEEVKPDVIILALGPKLVAPEVPGADRRNVMSGPELKEMMSGNLKGDGAKKLARWQRVALYLSSPFLQSLSSPSAIRRLTRVWMPLGKRVVVIGGDLAGCELAEFVAARGRKATALQSGEEIAPEIGQKRRVGLMKLLDEGHVSILTGVKCEEITSKGVSIVSKEGEKQVIEADTVILAGEVKPNMELYQAIEGKVPEVYLVGDCTELGLIRKATADAMSIACKI